MQNSQTSSKLVLSSGFFIVAFMALDATLNDEFDKIPREIIGGLVLVFLLSTFDFIGLGKLAGPFAVLIASTVFLTRGSRIFSKLRAISDTNSSDGGLVTGGFTGSPDIHDPEHQGV